MTDRAITTGSVSSPPVAGPACPMCSGQMSRYMRIKYGLCRYCYNSDANPPAARRRNARIRNIRQF